LFGNSRVEWGGVKAAKRRDVVVQQPLRGIIQLAPGILEGWEGRGKKRARKEV